VRHLDTHQRARFIVARFSRHHLNLLVHSNPESRDLTPVPSLPRGRGSSAAKETCRGGFRSIAAPPPTRPALRPSRRGP
jgi:hypothetical protein